MPRSLPNRCPKCSMSLDLEPSTTLGSVSCPHCRALLWFVRGHTGIHYFDHQATAEDREEVRQFLAEQLTVPPTSIPDDLENLDFKKLGADSLDIVELIMELDEEFDIFDDDDEGGAPPLGIA